MFPVETNAASFIEMTVDPQGSNRSDADKFTLLINRENITHVEVSLTKTPEQVWYKLVFHANFTVSEKQKTILLTLECNNTKSVNQIRNAIAIGSKKAIDAFETCRLIDPE